MSSLQMDIRSILDKKVNGATFAGIDTRTIPPLAGGRSNPYQGRIYKHVEGSNVMLFSNKTGSSYDRMVKRRLESIGMDPESFVLSPRTWGTRLPELPIVAHKGKFYLECIFLKAGRVTYTTLDGQEIAKDDIPGLPIREEAEQGGLPPSNKVIIRDYKFESIRRISIAHEIFEVVQLAIA